MKKLNLSKSQAGFTLIELLVVIGILAILLAITLIAINPNKHFQDTRNAKRSSDVSAILDAIYEYESSNNGSQPPAVQSVSTTAALGALAAENATAATTFSGGSLTYNGITGNLITGTSGTVTATGCTTGANNGSHTIVSTTGTSVTVTDASGVAGDTTCVLSGWSGRVDLCADVVPTFLANLPMDPAASGTACSSTYNSGYTISAANGRFTIAAPLAEGGANISVTR